MGLSPFSLLRIPVPSGYAAIQQRVCSNDSETIKANILPGFTAAHCASSSAAEYCLDKGDGSTGGSIRLEPTLLDEDCRMSSCNKTVRRLQVEPAKLAKILPQTRIKAMFIGYGDSLCLRSNEFTVDPSFSHGGFAVVDDPAIRSCSGGCVRLVHQKLKP